MAFSTGFFQEFLSSTTWTAPSAAVDGFDVTSVDVQCYGSGAHGGSAGILNNARGGGGGAFAQATVSVTPGTGYTVHVAAANAGDTYFGSTATVMAKGGSGPNGGTAAASVGTEKYSGGTSGGSGSGPSGGGGGAGDAGNGGNSGVQSPGAGGPTDGGAGGDATLLFTAGDGVVPGGGGGGESNNAGIGFGAAGLVRIRYFRNFEKSVSAEQGMDSSVARSFDLRPMSAEQQVDSALKRSFEKVISANQQMASEFLVSIASTDYAAFAQLKELLLQHIASWGDSHESSYILEILHSIEIETEQSSGF